MNTSTKTMTRQCVYFVSGKFVRWKIYTSMKFLVRLIPAYKSWGRDLRWGWLAGRGRVITKKKRPADTLFFGLLKSRFCRTPVKLNNRHPNQIQVTWFGFIHCKNYECCPGHSLTSQGPHLTLKKSDGKTKHLKHAFLTFTAIFSAKNGPKLKHWTFLESAVREFSENGFGSKKN